MSKDVVQRAMESKSMIILEDLKGIRKLYRKGNGQGNKYRRKLNSWSFYELQRQITYKAEWEGIPVGFVDPKRTSQLCPTCGGKLQEDGFHRRKLLCINCKRTMDRDVAASMNIACKGWSRLCHPRGLLVEPMKGNVDWNNGSMQPLILRVDGSKLVVGK
ncbi:MAG: transposase [Candidatus Nitrosotalea sp.]|nr:transposase [Candidatus Nitrosotalea sp.]